MQLGTGLVVKSLITFSGGLLLVDTAIPQSLDGLNRFTLEGALLIGLGVLWRAFMKKDDQALEMMNKFTEAVILVTKAVDKNSTAIERNTDAVEEMKISYNDHNDKEKRRIHTTDRQT